jgi:hypothetical protein
VDRRDERRDDPREYVRRRSLLHDDPGIELVDMATLVAIARAFGEGAVGRYARLAGAMDERGGAATA